MWNIHYEYECPLDNSGKAKEYLPCTQNNDKCRFCDRPKRELSFNDQSHVIPQAFGNRMLLSEDECDQCNHFFGEGIETSFASFLHPMRAMSSIPSRDKPLKYKKNKEFILYDKRLNKMIIQYDNESPNIHYRQDGDFVYFDIKAPPFDSSEIQRCLVRMALFTLKPEEITACVRKWLFGQAPNTRGTFFGAITPVGIRPEGFTMLRVLKYHDKVNDVSAIASIFFNSFLCSVGIMNLNPRPETPAIRIPTNLIFDGIFDSDAKEDIHLDKISGEAGQKIHDHIFTMCFKNAS
jgi:hypothetical protein